MENSDGDEDPQKLLALLQTNEAIRKCRRENIRGT